MASIYKRGRDKKNRHAVYWIEYNDHVGRRRVKKGFSDKALSEQLGAKLEHEAMLRKSGMIDAAEEKRAAHGKSKIEIHLNTFEQTLKKNTPKHVTLTMSRVRRVVEETGFETIRDLNAEAVQTFLRELLDEGELGHRTYNHYLQAVEAFGNWLVATHKLTANPLVGMEHLNTEVDIRHKRRALRGEEFAKLVQSARESGVEIQCFDGETRARIYILSYMTGLRRKELGSLTPRSFCLESMPPTLTLEAACSKHRRKDVLPLHPDLVVMLRDWLQGMAADEILFPKLANRRTWLMVKLDLERVGIPYENEEGIADFHAAGRHTHITELLRSGVSLVQAKELARHSDVKMTMRYTHVGIEDQATAVARLPWQYSSGLKNPTQYIGSISRGPNGPTVSSGDSGHSEEVDDPETPNPRWDGGYDATCLVMAASGMNAASMEAAGIEPASRDVSVPASTRVVPDLVLVALTPGDRIRRDQPGAKSRGVRARHGTPPAGFSD